MSRKVYVEVKVRLIVRMDDGEDAVQAGNVISEMDYGFTSQTEGADIEDTEITDYLVTDSK